MKNTTLRNWRRDVATSNLRHVPRAKALAAPPGAVSWLWRMLERAMQRCDECDAQRPRLHRLTPHERRAELLARLCAQLSDEQANQVIEWTHRPTKGPDSNG